jgi:S1-C subfamily serine protease
MRVTMVVTLTLLIVGGASADTGTEGWLGVELQTLTDELRLALDLPQEGGALVNSVVDGSPAARAGLERRDFITRFADHDVDGPRHLGTLVRASSPGHEVSVEIIRDADRQVITVQLDSRPEEEPVRQRRRPRERLRIPFLTGPRARLGVRVVDLSEQMAEFLRAPEATGALVMEVEDDSPAQRAGLRAGDIITHIDGEEVLDSSDLAGLLTEVEEGDTIRIALIRDGSTTELKAEIEEVEDSPSFWPGLPRFWRPSRQCCGVLRTT